MKEVVVERPKQYAKPQLDVNKLLSAQAHIDNVANMWTKEAQPVFDGIVTERFLLDPTNGDQYRYLTKIDNKGKATVLGQRLVAATGQYEEIRKGEYDKKYNKELKQGKIDLKLHKIKDKKTKVEYPTRITQWGVLGVDATPENSTGPQTAENLAREFDQLEQISYVFDRNGRPISGPGIDRPMPTQPQMPMQMPPAQGPSPDAQAQPPQPPMPDAQPPDPKAVEAPKPSEPPMSDVQKQIQEGFDKLTKKLDTDKEETSKLIKDTVGALESTMGGQIQLLEERIKALEAKIQELEGKSPKPASPAPMPAPPAPISVPSPRSVPVPPPSPGMAPEPASPVSVESSALSEEVQKIIRLLDAHFAVTNQQYANVMQEFNKINATLGGQLTEDKIREIVTAAVTTAISQNKDLIGGTTQPTTSESAPTPGAPATAEQAAVQSTETAKLQEVLGKLLEQMNKNGEVMEKISAQFEGQPEAMSKAMGAVLTAKLAEMRAEVSGSNVNGHSEAPSGEAEDVLKAVKEFLAEQKAKSASTQGAQEPVAVGSETEEAAKGNQPTSEGDGKGAVDQVVEGTREAVGAVRDAAVEGLDKLGDGANKVETLAEEAGDKIGAAISEDKSSEGDQPAENVSLKMEDLVTGAILASKDGGEYEITAGDNKNITIKNLKDNKTFQGPTESIIESGLFSIKLKPEAAKASEDQPAEGFTEVLEATAEQPTDPKASPETQEPAPINADELEVGEILVRKSDGQKVKVERIEDLGEKLGKKITVSLGKATYEHDDGTLTLAYSKKIEEPEQDPAANENADRKNPLEQFKETAQTALDAAASKIKGAVSGDSSNGQAASTGNDNTQPAEAQPIDPLLNPYMVGFAPSPAGIADPQGDGLQGIVETDTKAREAASVARDVTPTLDGLHEAEPVEPRGSNGSRPATAPTPAPEPDQSQAQRPAASIEGSVFPSVDDLPEFEIRTPITREAHQEAPTAVGVVENSISIRIDGQTQDAQLSNGSQRPAPWEFVGGGSNIIDVLPNTTPFTTNGGGNENPFGPNTHSVAPIPVGYLTSDELFNGTGLSKDEVSEDSATTDSQLADLHAALGSSLETPAETDIETETVDEPSLESAIEGASFPTAVLLDNTDELLERASVVEIPVEETAAEEISAQGLDVQPDAFQADAEQATLEVQMPTVEGSEIRTGEQTDQEDVKVRFRVLKKAKISDEERANAQRNFDSQVRVKNDSDTGLEKVVGLPPTPTQQANIEISTLVSRANSLYGTYLPKGKLTRLSNKNKGDVAGFVNELSAYLGPKLRSSGDYSSTDDEIKEILLNVQ